MRADMLVKHEAGSEYSHGFAAVYELVRSLGLCLIGIGVLHLQSFLPARGASKRFHPSHAPVFFRLCCQATGVMSSLVLGWRKENDGCASPETCRLLSCDSVIFFLFL